MRISFDLTVRLDAYSSARQLRAFRKARADFLERQKRAEAAGVGLAEQQPEKPEAIKPHKVTLTLDLAGQGLDPAEQRALLMRLSEAAERSVLQAAADFKAAS
jgi:hypothetical protein